MTESPNNRPVNYKLSPRKLKKNALPELKEFIFL